MSEPFDRFSLNFTQMFLSVRRCAEPMTQLRGSHDPVSCDINNDQDGEPHGAFEELKNLRLKNRDNVIVTHLNVNSLRYKFMELGEILYDKLSDICFFSETKLDDTFNQSSFDVPGYKAFRHDRNSSGGGLIAYVRSNLPARRRHELEFAMPLESIVLDVSINNRKWAIVGVYRPPSMDNKIFTDLFTRGMDLISTKIDNVLTLGDLNYDCLDRTRGSTLLDLCDIFDFKNIFKTATCFMKNCQPSLVDVILTNLCFGALNFGCGISDWHKMIGVAVRGAEVREQKQKTKYRSFKNYDPNEFNEDVSQVPFHAAYVFDDIDDIYWAHERLLTDIIDKHAPVKERVLKSRRPAFMNGDLRRAVYKKKMLFNKYKNSRSAADWDNYRKQRNNVTKLKKQSMRVYFYERCRRTFGPPSNPSYLIRLVVVGTKSFFAKKIKLSQSSGRSANFSMIILSMLPKILANLQTNTKMIFLITPV